MNYLRNIDLFGSKFSLNVLGKEKYKTVHGGILTLLTVVLMAVVTFLFGKDFIFKLNPKVFSKTEISAFDKFLTLENEKFSYMWVVEGSSGKFPTGDEIVFFPRIVYKKWDKQEDNSWKVTNEIYPTAKKCSESSNKNNPYIQNFDLSTWNCIDWEEVSDQLGEPAKLGGQWDGNRLYSLIIQFRTCYFDTKTGKIDLERCSSFEKVSETLSKGSQYFSFNIPYLSFDTTDYEDPFKVSYKYNFYKASNTLKVAKYFYFNHETLFDDRGWILEDRVERKEVNFSYERDILSVATSEDFEKSKNQNFFNLVTYFTKEEKVKYRS